MPCWRICFADGSHYRSQDGAWSNIATHFEFGNTPGVPPTQVYLTLKPVLCLLIWPSPLSERMVSLVSPLTTGIPFFAFTRMRQSLDAQQIEHPTQAQWMASVFGYLLPGEHRRLSYTLLANGQEELAITEPDVAFSFAFSSPILPSFSFSSLE